MGSSATGPARWLYAVLAHRFMPVGVALLAVALTLPAIGKGLWWDDLVHRSTLLESAAGSELVGEGRSSAAPATRPPAVAARRLFAFIEPGFAPRLMDLGVLPWWTLPDLRISFWRPLAALTHWIDYRLWPDSPRLMHAHSIAWYALLGLAAALAYRRLLRPGWVAGLAALLFAVDDVHADLVAWVANRSALLSATFGLLSLVAHDRWRRGGWPAGAFVGPLLLALAVLSAEGGIATLAYFAAHAVFLDREPVGQRLRALLPYAAIVIGWRLLYQGLGFGTWGSEIYVDPVLEPARFAAAVLERGPILVLGQLGWPDPMMYSFLSTGGRRALWLAALLAMSVVGGLMAAQIHREPVARFWAAGMLFALLPAIGAGIPSGRVLPFIGFGATGLVAGFIGGIIDRAGWTAAPPWRAMAQRGLCLVLVLLHVVWAPVQLATESWRPGPTEARLDRVSDIGAPSRERRVQVLVLNPPSPFHFLYGPSARRVRNEAEPMPVRLLAPGYAALEVTGVDPHALDLRPALGYLAPPDDGGLSTRKASDVRSSVFFYRQLDGTFRSRSRPFRLGEQIELTGMRAEVTALTADGRPQQVRLRFARALDDPASRWLVWDWAIDAYRTFTPPRAGETVRIPGPF